MVDYEVKIEKLKAELKKKYPNYNKRLESDYLVKLTCDEIMGCCGVNVMCDFDNIPFNMIQEIDRVALFILDTLNLQYPTIMIVNDDEQPEILKAFKWINTKLKNKTLFKHTNIISGSTENKLTYIFYKGLQ